METAAPRWIAAAAATLVALAITAVFAVLLATCSFPQTLSTPAKPGLAPAPRFAASAAYDAERGQFVLFGGSVNRRIQLDETWTWDGHGWTQHHPAGKPPGRQFASMTYDAARHVVVLFGGATSFGLIQFGQHLLH